MCSSSHQKSNYFSKYCITEFCSGTIKEKSIFSIFKDHVRTFADNYVHGDSRFAVMQFSFTSKIEFKLDDPRTKAEKLDMVDSMEQLLGYTFMANAIRYEFSDQLKFRRRLGRDNFKFRREIS